MNTFLWEYYKKNPTDIKRKISSNKSAWSTRNLGDNTLGGINILKQEFGDMKSHFESKIEKLWQTQTIKSKVWKENLQNSGKRGKKKAILSHTSRIQYKICKTE